MLSTNNSVSTEYCKYIIKFNLEDSPFRNAICRIGIRGAIKLMQYYESAVLRAMRARFTRGIQGSKLKREMTMIRDTVVTPRLIIAADARDRDLNREIRENQFRPPRRCTPADSRIDRPSRPQRPWPCRVTY